jgi:HSP20 family protein
MARETIRSSRDNDRARSANASARSSAQRAASARANESAYGASAGAPAADRERAIQTSRDTARRPSSRASANNNAAANARNANARASSNANANANNASPNARNNPNANARNNPNANLRNAPSANPNANPNAHRDQPGDRDRIPAIYQYAAGLNATPFTLIRRMAEDMDRIFQDFGLAHAAPALGAAAARNNAWRQSSTYAQSWAPAIETFRRGDRLVIRADLPGLSKDDVKVEVDGDLLAISGERHDEYEEDREDYYRSERSYGRFYRAIPLPDGVQADDCNASFRDGVLEVTLAAPQSGADARREIRVS